MIFLLLSPPHKMLPIYIQQRCHGAVWGYYCSAQIWASWFQLPKKWRQRSISRRRKNREREKERERGKICTFAILKRVEEKGEWEEGYL
jgi:hypothetical protein